MTGDANGPDLSEIQRHFRFGAKHSMRYGENPHQEGFLYEVETTDPLALQNFAQLQGKELSFNNYLDMDGALYGIAQIATVEPAAAACVVVKHTNPCGAAIGATALEAHAKAWDGDSLAAFGGIIAINRPIDAPLAKAMLADRKFVDVLCAPAVDDAALAVFARRPNIRVMVNPALATPAYPTDLDVKRVRGGFLVQEPETRTLTAADLTVAGTAQPTLDQIRNLLFAWAICRASKSNTIAIAKDGMLVGSGVGQQDRKRCCELAVAKSLGRAGGAAAASDAYFPFADGPEVLIDAGVTAIVEPGGSLRDQETIDLCNKRGVALLFTGGVRAFRH
jgi:phosphoribosylaminoimidazolecarboxamide formyltransferase / IMP cyclohydrolase